MHRYLNRIDFVFSFSVWWYILCTKYQQRMEMLKQMCIIFIQSDCPTLPGFPLLILLRSQISSCSSSAAFCSPSLLPHFNSIYSLCSTEHFLFSHNSITFGCSTCYWSALENISFVWKCINFRVRVYHIAWHNIDSHGMSTARVYVFDFDWITCGWINALIRA